MSSATAQAPIMRISPTDITLPVVKEKFKILSFRRLSSQLTSFQLTTMKNFLKPHMLTMLDKIAESCENCDVFGRLEQCVKDTTHPDLRKTKNLY